MNIEHCSICNHSTVLNAGATFHISLNLSSRSVLNLIDLLCLFCFVLLGQQLNCHQHDHHLINLFSGTVNKMREINDTVTKR